VTIYQLPLSNEDMICNRNQQIKKDINCISYVISSETDFKERVRNFSAKFYIVLADAKSIIGQLFLDLENV